MVELWFINFLGRKAPPNLTPASFTHHLACLDFCVVTSMLCPVMRCIMGQVFSFFLNTAYSVNGMRSLLPWKQSSAASYLSACRLTDAQWLFIIRRRLTRSDFVYWPNQCDGHRPQLRGSWFRHSALAKCDLLELVSNVCLCMDILSAKLNV